MEIEKLLYMRAIAEFGAENQKKMLFEELAELQNAVCKYDRGRGSKDSIAEEIADVRIMIEQIIRIYRIPEEQVEVWKNKKLARLSEILSITEDRI